MITGVEFRSMRESRGLTIDAIAAATRITPRMIEAVERNDLRALPPRPYARGFVAAYGRELGLDPNEAVSCYFAQFQPPPAAEAPVAPRTAAIDEVDRNRRLFRAIGTALVAIALTVTLTSQWRSARQAEPGARGTSGAAAIPAATDAAAPIAAPATGSSPQGAGGLVILLTFDGRSWVAASADGNRVVYRMVEAGATETLRAHREITLRLGNAGVVRASVNGKPAAPLGRSGEVRTITIAANSEPTATR